MSAGHYARARAGRESLSALLGSRQHQHAIVEHAHLIAHEINGLDRANGFGDADAADMITQAIEEAYKAGVRVERARITRKITEGLGLAC